MRGTFALEQAGVVVAEAAKPSAFRRAFEIRAGPHQYRLAASSVFGRAFELSDGETVIGTIRPESWWGRTATVDLPNTLSSEVQLFTLFLVIVLWKREADAAAS